jgi:hypothetical protein
MRPSRRRRAAAAALAVLGSAAVAVAPACNRSAAAKGPFDGARPFALASAADGRAPTPQEFEQLVAAAIEVAGGKERLRKLSWRRVEDLYLSHAADPMGNHVLTTTTTRADVSLKLRHEYKSGDVEEMVIFQGEELFRPKQGQLGLATGVTQQYVEWQWEVSRLPELLNRAASLEPLPPRVVEGCTLVGARVEIADMNPKFEVWIDLAGPMVVEASADIPIVGAYTARSRAIQTQRFSEFRRVDGVLFPFRRDLLIDGVRFGLAETRLVEVDVRFEDADFVTPELLEKARAPKASPPSDETPEKSPPGKPPR